jgi:hypothetical protein
MGGAWLIVMCGLEVVGRSQWASEAGLGGVLHWSGVPWWSSATGGGGLTPSLPRCVKLWSISVDTGGGLRRLVGLVVVTPRVSKPHDYANHMFMRL